MDRKLLNAFNALVNRCTMLQFGYDSSSQQMEEKLRNYGVVPPVKLYYEYKYPNAKTGAEYEKFISRLSYILWIYSREHVTKPEEFFKQEFEDTVNFYQAATGEYERNMAQRCMRAMQDIEKYLFTLTESERNALADRIEHDKSLAYETAKNQVAELKRLNPELQSVRVGEGLSIMEFMDGVAYGFAPQEIDYFINTDMEQRNADAKPYNDILDKFNLVPWYFVRPDRLKKIVDVVQAHMIQTNKVNGISNG